LRKKESDREYLAHIKYALLGLGDSNYTTFGGFPQSLDKQLQKLGAQQVYDFKLADDAVGLEIVVDPWIESLWEALIKQEVCPVSSLAELTISDLDNVITPKIDESTIKQPNISLIEEKNLKKSLPVPDLETCSAPNVATLILSVEPLSKSNLKVPVLAKSYLEIDFLPDDTEFVVQNPIAPPFIAPIKNVKQLSSPGALKTTLEINLDLSDSEFEYNPGDTVGVYCTNNAEEVKELLKRLGLEGKENVPIQLNMKHELASLNSASKSKYEIPSHLPTSPTTLRYVLQHCCEIRSVPKKGLVRMLAEHTSHDGEKRRLLELCSSQGSDDYTTLIRQTNVNVLDLLNSFSSCHPPIASLLEHWPRLLSRPYSLSSSPLKGRTASFVFNVLQFTAEEGRTYERKGVATGQLEEAAEEMNIQEDCYKKLSFCSRPNNGFKLPPSVETPLILIGPGTGVAPFIGFLAHREEQLKLNPTDTFGPIWLFFGCRTKDKDYLYKTELEKWHSSGVLTRLLVCFSRESVAPQPKYVQDLICQHETQVAKLISKGAVIYVCGDEKNMAKDVMKAVTNAIQNVHNVSTEEATKTVFQLQKDKRYLQDIWT